MNDPPYRSKTIEKSLAQFLTNEKKKNKTKSKKNRRFSTEAQLENCLGNNEKFLNAFLKTRTFYRKKKTYL